MKKIIIIFAAIIFLTFQIQADVYVRGILHVDGGYRWGQNVPENNAVYEWWFGKDKITFIVTGWRLLFLNTDRRLTFDTQKNRIIAADLMKKSYIEIPLSRNPFTQIDKKLAERLKRYKMSGTVKKTGKKQTFLFKNCEEYHAEEWIIQGDVRYYERERKVLSSIDIPFDCHLVDKLYEWIRFFFNPRESYVREIKKIRGFVLNEEGTIYESAGKVIYNFKVEKITHSEPPPGIYDAPKGFQKMKNFTRRDLSDIIELLYPWPLQ